MGLKIIGSGFGRTGTMLTKMALEKLGFGPCHHMVEVMENTDQPPHWAALAAIFDTMDTLVLERVFGGLDRERSIAAYRRNNERVRATIPADQLLVFNPVDGWDPLCHFLGVPAPTGDFPRSNARDEFWAMFGGEPAVAV